MEYYTDIKEQDFSFLGRGSFFQGEIQINGPCRVSSSIKGNISLKKKTDNEPNEQLLVIEADGLVEGKIDCHHLEIYGQVDGEINSTGIVSIFPSGIFTGVIQSASLVIHPGSQVEMNARTSADQ